MKRIMPTGPSQYGKTSLMQCIRGEALHYQKAQVIVWSPTTIDTPGEHLKNHCSYSASPASTCEAGTTALVLSADAPQSPFSSGFTGLMNRSVIGPVTKTDLVDPQRISLVESWLVQAGAQKVLTIGALENAGVDEIFIFLSAKEPSCPTK